MRKFFIHVVVMVLFLYNVLNLNIKAEHRQYDIVIVNGNVYDPGSKLFLRNINIGIKNGKITTITRNEIFGSEDIDATGKIVCPGFIDTFQRHFGELFDEVRLKDGVTSSIYALNEWSENVALSEKNTISHINRVLLFDLTPTLSNLDKVGDEAFTENDKNALKSQLEKGFSGVFYNVLDINEILKLDFLPDGYPLFLEFGMRADDEIVPYLIKTRENNPTRHIHIVETNRYNSILRPLIKLITEDGNISMGGHTFSYLITNPIKENGKRFQTFMGKDALRLENRFITAVDESFKKEDKTYAILSLLSDEDKNILLFNKAFTGESFSLYPGGSMCTQDANTFMGRLFQAKDDRENLFKVIDAFTTSPRDLFKTKTSPLSLKGKIQIGMDADILVFNPEDIAQFSFINGDIAPSHGLSYVIREGVIVIENGEALSNYPKARYLTIGALPYSIDDDFTIREKGKKKSSLPVLSFDNMKYIPIESLVNYLNLTYKVENTKLYIGDLIQLEIGQRHFSTGSNKTDMDNDILLISDQPHINAKDLEKVLNEFYKINLEENHLELKKGKKFSLLNTNEEKKVDLRMNTKFYSMPLSYLIAIILVIVFFKSLNGDSKKERKKDEGF